MSETKLRTAILGLTSKGQELLEAAEQSGRFGIVAVAGRDTESLQAISEKHQATAYEDYRQLVVQNELDLLLVAGSMQYCGEHIRTALKKKIDVVRLVPPGLDFEQTSELVVTAKKEKSQLIVANIWRYVPSFIELSNYFRAEGTENVHLVTIDCNVYQSLDDSKDRWLTDPAVAGGGVLMHECYGIIDLINQIFGVPQQVYSLNTNHAPDKQQRLSLTEDTAVVTMRYSDTLIVNLVTSRTFGPWMRRIRLHTDSGYITVTEDEIIFCDHEGNVKDLGNFDFDPQKLMVQCLENIADVKENPEATAYYGGMENDLNTMAVIESAYLSAKTATPEEPSKILSIVRSEPQIFGLKQFP